MQSATTFSTLTAPVPSRIRSLLRAAWRQHALLALTGLAMMPLIVIGVVGLFVDHQVITGATAWMKPLKFYLSILIYSFTLLYLLSLLRDHPRIARVMATVTAISLVVEVVLITMQVIRGTTSHFNDSTPFDAAVFATMGTMIGLLWLAGMGIVVMLLRQRMPDSAWAWALRLGMMIAVAGMAVAFLMTMPTSAQLAAARSGVGDGIMGAHSVGVADGGPGLPLLGWSTVGGDLRVPHFFGLHGLQAMLVVGWLLARMKSWLDIRHRVALAITAGVGYLGFVGLLTWQALRAQSLIHPDAASLLAFGSLGLATIVSAMIVLVHGRAEQRLA